MRTLLSSGAILLVLNGPALAKDATQADSRGSSPPNVELAQTQMPPQGGTMPGGGQGQSGSSGTMTANPEMAQQMREMMRRHMREHEEEEGEHERSSRRGAFVRFKRGDVEFDIRCPTDESMRDCVADATTLLDKLATMPSQPSPSR